MAAKSLHKAVLSAIIYMGCSLAIIFSNKLVLTNYHFPSYILLAAIQTLFTFVVLQTLFISSIRSTEIPDLSVKIVPLSLCSTVDIVMGIAGTGSLSLPLFTALRRLSNFLILVGEHYLLGTTRDFSTYCTVASMLIGALIAAAGDITFDALGYTYIMINNVSTAGKALLTKSRLRDYNFSSVELLYFNSLYMLPLFAIIVYLNCDFEKLVEFPHWIDPIFLIYFTFSCCSAVALNYSLVQCTRFTSALTTSILGVAKNIVVTYAGMFIGGDYVYTHANFIGVTVSAIGATLYVFFNYKRMHSEKRDNRTP